MSLSLRAFLDLIRSVAGRAEAGTVRIVCGNEASDFDSVASVLAYSFFCYLNNLEDTNPIVPVVNLNREDLKIRKDIVIGLQRVHISEDQLFFLEDLRRWKQNNTSVEAVLVDHNEVVNEAKSCIDKVIGVIDHHLDAGLYKDVEPRIIKVCGSCTSLVFKYWYERLSELIETCGEGVQNVILLSLGALLLDTANFKQKVEKTDRDTMAIYERLMPDIDRTQLFKELKKAKKDISGLSVKQVLMKDYKQFEFTCPKADGSSTVKIGISSLVKCLDKLYDIYDGLDPFRDQCVAFRKERDLDALMLMCSWTDDNDIFRRQLVSLPSDNSRDLVAEAIKSVKDQLNLEVATLAAASTQGKFPDDYTTFEQLNTKASRKQVVPLLKQAFETL